MIEGPAERRRPRRWAEYRNLGAARQLAGRLAGFTFIPLMSFLSPLLLMPAIARVSGAAGWSSIGAAQAIGSMLGTVTLFGWAASGPARLADLPSASEKRDLYRGSVTSRGVLLAAGLVPAGVASVSLAATEWRVTSILMVAATATVGLSPSWYCVALAKPAMLFRYEVLPRAVTTVASLFVVLAFRQVWMYPVLTVLGVLAGLLALDRQEFGGERSGRKKGAITSTLRAQWPVAATSLVSAVYVALPVPFAVAIGSVGEAAGFASGQKLYLYVAFAIIALTNSLQGWALAHPLRQRARRAKAAMGLHVVLGVAGFAFLSLAGPVATEVLFGSDVAADRATSTAFGLCFACVAVSTAMLRYILIPAGRARVGLYASVVGAVIGVPSMFVLGNALGVAGAAFGLLVCEAVVMLVSLLPARAAVDVWAGAAEPRDNHEHPR